MQFVINFVDKNRITSHYSSSRWRKNTFDNCIPLCFDCHSDMGKIDKKHPRGTQYSSQELYMHRDNWYKQVASGNNIYSQIDEKVFLEDKNYLKV